MCVCKKKEEQPARVELRFGFVLCWLLPRAPSTVAAKAECVRAFWLALILLTFLTETRLLLPSHNYQMQQ